jgi:hypothetical protein
MVVPDLVPGFCPSIPLYFTHISYTAPCPFLKTAYIYRNFLFALGWVWWVTPVIQATQGTEIGKIIFQPSPLAKM